MRTARTFRDWLDGRPSAHPQQLPGLLHDSGLTHTHLSYVRVPEEFSSGLGAESMFVAAVTDASLFAARLCASG